MRNMNGRLIGMDSPITAAFQTMQGLAAIVGLPYALLARGHKWLDEEYDFHLTDVPYIGGAATAMDDTFGMLFGWNEDWSEQMRRASTSFAGFGVNAVMAATGIMSGKNLFTQREMDGKEAALTVLGAVNPFGSRVVRFVDHLLGDRDSGLIVMNYLLGARVYGKGDLERWSSWQTKAMTEELSLVWTEAQNNWQEERGFPTIQGDEIVPIDQLESALKELGLWTYEIKWANDIVKHTFTTGNDWMSDPEYREGLYADNGMLRRADGSIGSFPAIPSGLVDELTESGEFTAVGQHMIEMYQRDWAQHMADVINLQWLGKEAGDGSKRLVYPNGESVALINPVMLLNMLTASTTIEVQNYYEIEGVERRNMFAEAGPDTFASNMKVFQGLVQTFANEQISPEVAPVWLATMDPMLDLGERIAKDAQLAGLTDEEMFTYIVDEVLGSTEKAQIYKLVSDEGFALSGTEAQAVVDRLDNWMMTPQETGYTDEEGLQAITDRASAYISLVDLMAQAAGIEITEEFYNTVMERYVVTTITGSDILDVMGVLDLPQSPLQYPPTQQLELGSPEELQNLVNEFNATMEGLSSDEYMFGGLTPTEEFGQRGSRDQLELEPSLFTPQN